MRLTAIIIAALNLISVLPAHAAKSTLHMREGGTVFPPKGFRDFCARIPADCAASAVRPNVVTLTSKRLRQLEDVQRSVNATVRYQSDQVTYGESERWAYPTVFGDCEDFALAKRQRLIELGWPRSSLLFGIGKLASGQYHLVLIAVTDQGDMVLDSNASKLRHWLDMPMRWVMRQSATNEKRWRSIKAPRLPRVRPEVLSAPSLAVAGR